jgi:penicillin amidase
MTFEDVIVGSGLRQSAEIGIDPYGIAHIRAASLDDLFFAQGFNAARERLWQIDLWRKRGLGQLAADFGPGFLAQDAASRLFLYRGDMAAEWKAYGPDARAICQAFCAGLNAYIDLCAAEPRRLPEEFAVMGTLPARWAPEDIVRIRTHGLSRNLVSEVLRAHISAAAGPAIDRLRKRLEPAVDLEADPPLDAPVPLEVLCRYRLACARATLSPERLAAGMAQAWLYADVNESGDVVASTNPRAAERPALAPEGSNNWVVGPAHSETGRPILANDPHRALCHPSLRYLVHLCAPGFDAIGAGEPMVPGIAIGHNGQVAFGLTIFGSDQEDLYVYETKAGSPEFYRYREGYERFETIEERITVKGASDQSVTLAFSRHGPILWQDPGSPRAYGLRTVWSEPGAAPYLHSLGAMRAGTLAAFLEAVKGWGTPSVNFVCADIAGDIAWIAAGMTPVRGNWTGLLPVPGDGQCEWQGFVAPQSMPQVINPAKGFFASANEMNLPAGFAHRIGYEWVEASRARRIDAVLSGSAHSLEKACALQKDVVSLPALRLAALVANLKPGNATLVRAQRLLALWDKALDTDSAAALLFEVWWTRHLVDAVLERLVADPSLRRLLAPCDTESLLRLLEAPDQAFGVSATEQRDGLLAKTLTAAFEDCTRLGGDAGWAWGRLHQAYFEHDLSAVLGSSARARFDIGPLPMPGGASTPLHAAYRKADFRLTSGASVRLVIDVGAFDNSLAINAPGQSGDCRSPHYRDLAPLWSAGSYVPLTYSAAKVDASLTRRIRLLPS